MSRCATQPEPVFVDFETRSSAPLGEVGGRGYVRHHDTELLCAVAVQGRRGWAWGPWPTTEALALRGLRAHDPSCEWSLHYGEDPPAEVLALLERGAPLVAHNAYGFDVHVWRALGYPEPVGGWVDSVELARRAGLPGGLDAVAQRLYGRGKDKGGRKIMLLLSTPNARGDFTAPAPVTFARLLAYCALDVLLLQRLWADEDLGLPHHDDEVLRAHRAIDERGVPIDLDYVARLGRAEQRLRTEATARVASALAGRPVTSGPGFSAALDLLQSPAQLGDWLRRQGLDVAGAAKDDLSDLDPEQARDPVAARAVLAGRATVANVVRGKVEALTKRTCPDGRYRGALAYYGAQATGRWAGRGAQLQNFTRGGDAPEPEAATEIAHLQRALRNVVRAPLQRSRSGALTRGSLITVDFSQVEARGLLWLAGDEESLDVYRQGRDPYLRMAARTFGVDEAELVAAYEAGDTEAKQRRSIGKVQVLALGYGGGYGSLKRYWADIEAAGLAVPQVVEAWRDAHPLVAGVRTGGVFQVPERDETPAYPVQVRRGGLWRELFSALKEAHGTLGVPPGELYVTHEGDEAHSVAFHAATVNGRRDVLCVLPSGRELRYRNVRYEDRPNKFSEDPDATKRSLVYDHANGVRDLYPGILAENVTQATCRDLLAEGLVRLEAAGFRVVLHVHDEVVVEVPHPADSDAARKALAEVTQILETVPEWAAGFPIAAEGCLDERWAK